MMENEPKKSAAGQWIVLSEERRNEISELLNDAAAYEATLLSTGDAIDFFVSTMVEKSKTQTVTIVKAKSMLKALSIDFNDKKAQVTAVIEKIKRFCSDINNVISELDHERFIHRIENFQDVLAKLEPHIKRFEMLAEKIDELKKVKLEEEKAAIMRGHRKGYFENFQ